MARGLFAERRIIEFRRITKSVIVTAVFRYRRDEVREHDEVSAEKVALVTKNYPGIADLINEIIMKAV